MSSMSSTKDKFLKFLDSTEFVWLMAGLLLGYLLFHSSALYENDYSGDDEIGQWGE
jgi:hypothetical protein